MPKVHLQVELVLQPNAQWLTRGDKRGEKQGEASDEKT